jgi:beta-glucosidase
MMSAIGTCAFNTGKISSIDKPTTTEADGPVGFTNFMGDPTIYDTCNYASACIVAATWNVDLAYKLGAAVGNEALIGNEAGDGVPYSGWYAPGVNIHRSQFGGRNTEYYSEDGLLAGKLGSAVVQGAKSKGVYTYVKHFVLNDQETDRSTMGLLTWADEQSMRELYFKPFEYIVKEGEATGIMTSFNRIGTTWAGGSYNLLTEVLRNEWGFHGSVITDYDYMTPYMYGDLMIRAGGDLNFGQSTNISDLSTPTQVACLRRATHNMLYTVANSNAMNGHGEGVVYGYALPYWVIGVICVDVVVFVGLAVWGVFAILKALKNKNVD